MALLIAFAVILVGTSVISYLTSHHPQDTRSDEADITASWDRAFASEDGPIGAGMSKIARSIGRTTFVNEAANNKALAPLAAKVVASGSYGQSLEVFLAYSAASLFVSSAMLVIVVGVDMFLPIRLSLAVIAIVLALLPYNKVSTAAKKKAEAAALALPEFVELLQMPLASGMTVVEALRFTANFTDSVVSYEVRWLIDTLAARSMDEADAFREAGARIGTPEASAFFTALGQAHIDGTRVQGALAKQADTLRVQSYQLRRVKIKRLPVKLIVKFAVHFLPLLFILAMLPLVFSLQHM